ncbi:hypothetical protein QBK99_10995 [Corticibacterium sp. UT-5YL-CI-8]|nr:hypothetical protein [Tianweitania sp. UT-5YL-CI-8]
MTKSKQPKPDLTSEAILPLTDFRDDPWGTGDKKAVAFKAGVLSSPVPAEFADKMRADGKAAGAAKKPASDKAADQSKD